MSVNGKLEPKGVASQIQPQGFGIRGHYTKFWHGTRHAAVSRLRYARGAGTNGHNNCAAAVVAGKFSTPIFSG